MPLLRRLLHPARPGFFSMSGREPRHPAAGSWQGRAHLSSPPTIDRPGHRLLAAIDVAAAVLGAPPQRHGRGCCGSRSCHGVCWVWCRWVCRRCDLPARHGGPDRVALAGGCAVARHGSVDAISYSRSSSVGSPGTPPP
ncbi:hypothetical protein PVAP13_1NG509419 [Panicum virgatum]|uniref:Uncharacterized protein n=1 Tax=Panicum virgatum TaxID=38727 RepID=A0A8T0XBC6_PANVG|nr:hypothetical protein PVAP13_1NG509419 [Panicum virgatum]